MILYRKSCCLSASRPGRWQSVRRFHPKSRSRRSYRGRIDPAAAPVPGATGPEAVVSASRAVRGQPHGQSPVRIPPSDDERVLVYWLRAFYAGRPAPREFAPGWRGERPHRGRPELPSAGRRRSALCRAIRASCHPDRSGRRTCVWCSSGGTPCRDAPRRRVPRSCTVVPRPEWRCPKR